jgi:hypothetical protein
MGFLLRSAFWLGIVYNAMPLDVASLTPAATAGPPAAIPSESPLATSALQSCLGAVASACIGAPAELCAKLAAAANGAAEHRPVEATTAPPRLRRLSADTLTPSDRAQPWRGPPPRAQG